LWWVFSRWSISNYLLGWLWTVCPDLYLLSR
jgi:hypothetical protein